MSDEPDTSDIPEAGEAWFEKAKLRLPRAMSDERERIALTIARAIAAGKDAWDAADALLAAGFGDLSAVNSEEAVKRRKQEAVAMAIQAGWCPKACVDEARRETVEKAVAWLNKAAVAKGPISDDWDAAWHAALDAAANELAEALAQPAQEAGDA